VGPLPLRAVSSAGSSRASRGVQRRGPPSGGEQRRGPLRSAPVGSRSAPTGSAGVFFARPRWDRDGPPSRGRSLRRPRRCPPVRSVRRPDAAHRPARLEPDAAHRSARLEPDAAHRSARLEDPDAGQSAPRATRTQPGVPLRSAATRHDWVAESPGSTPLSVPPRASFLCDPSRSDDRRLGGHSAPIQARSRYPHPKASCQVHTQLRDLCDPSVAAFTHC